MNALVENILSFWFGTSFTDEFPPRSVSDKWFSFDNIIDEYIRRTFLIDVKRALVGEYDDLAKTSKGRLALIILLDQFTRHIYRNTPRAFSGDAKALALTLEPIHWEMAEELLICEKIFYFGPLEHSERLEDQKKHMSIYNHMLQQIPKPVADKLKYYVHWFQVHHDVIKEFGRFPWRNAILDRTSTAHELQYLLDAPDFGQKLQT